MEVPADSCFAEADSDLSDAPSQLDCHTYPEYPRNTFNGAKPSSKLKPGNLSSIYTQPEDMDSEHVSDSGVSDMSDDDNDGESISERPLKRQRTTPPQHDLSKFETLPAEILQDIASRVADDTSFCNLMLACRMFNSVLSPKYSSTWQDRFLARYDYPLVDRPDQYHLAYKLRRFMHRNLVEYSNGKDKRWKLQLENMRDMVLETYRQPRPYLPSPFVSKNLAALSSPSTSPWMRDFLSSPFFNCNHQKHGRPNTAFDIMQLIFTHLLISPKSPMAHVVHSSRENYDLAKVYNWNLPFSTLYTLLPGNQTVAAPMDNAFMSSIFPNLKVSKQQVMRPEKKCKLDLFTLLHIRNFWYRHLIDNGTKFVLGTICENTYARMAERLADRGLSPSKWEKPLQDSKANLEGILTGKWHGHYSCLTPWPKQRQDLDERQSNAEDWDYVDPLTLNFSTSTDNKADGFWPPMFSTIPAFATTSPDPDKPSSKCVFLRGIAPFMELSDHDIVKTSPTSDTKQALPKYHPFLALRLRGVVHPIASQWEIPGWHRLIMILYKPSARYLVQVLEHDEEEYGNPFGAVITNSLQAAPVQSVGNNNSSSQPQVNLEQSTDPPTTTTVPNSTTNILDPVEAERLLRNHLKTKLTSNPAYSASKMDKDAIEALEESFSPSEYLEWNDMDYAYAYEGVLLPGGKIMMGRWWRIAEIGTGPGKEVDAMGEDVGNFGADDAEATDASVSSDLGNGIDAMDLDGGQETTTTSNGSGNGNEHAQIPAPTQATNRQRNLERGPFVFWC